MSVDSSLGAVRRSGATQAITKHVERSRLDPPYARALGALITLPLLGLLMCVAATKTNSILPQSVRPVPSWMAGPYHFIGFTLNAGELIIATILMFAAYWVVVRNAGRYSARQVIIAIVAFNVIVLLGPPLISTDVFSYQAYARMFANYATNPYLHGPVAIQPDDIYNYIGSKWVTTPSVYGPVFTLLSGIWSKVSLQASLYIFKAIAALSTAGTVWLLWKSAKLRGVDPVKAVALFGLNPLVVLYGIGGGHNDLLMLLFTTAGVYAMLKRYERTSGALVVAGAGIKLTGAVLLPFMLLAKLSDRPTRLRVKVLVGAVAAAIVIGVAGFFAFGTAILHITRTLSNVQDQGGWQSVPGLLFTILRVPVTHAGTLAFGGIFVAICLWLLWRVYQGRMDWIEGGAWATIALLLSAGSVQPWYISWLIPVIALCNDHRLWRWAIGMTVLVGMLTALQFIPKGIPILGIVT
jgi:alpha-1,6-mannosyltransferase